jgi:hypothetical protein
MDLGPKWYTIRKNGTFTGFTEFDQFRWWLSYTVCI